MEYRLKDAFAGVGELPPSAENGVVCVEVNPDIAYSFNQLQGRLFYYAFSIVTSGWMTLLYNGREITVNKGDIYNYTPGFTVSVVNTSEDYLALCLLAKEDFTHETPVVRNVIRAAYLPFVELQEPKITLSASDFDKLHQRMQDFVDCQQSDHLFRDDLLRLLYATFLLDLLNIQERQMSSRHQSERSEELFLGFIHLLRLHFVEHHDIPFYAERLSITPIYLSRIVKQMTGRTVVDYINQMLLMEASWLLLTTHTTVVQIAERLHFSSHASFIRFFKRLKGITPKQYRMVR